ncbi:MAG TPA: response regulator [Bryobacteraceae bacterium]|nr:response regulator [Bryobacteraceae bacterium]
MTESADFHHWSVRDVARLRALLEAELRYFREIAAILPVPLAILSKDRAIVWSNRAFRSRFGELPARDLLHSGFTELPLRAWHDEDETETLLVATEAASSTPAGTGTLPRELPAILWQADTATLQFRSVEGSMEEMLGYPRSHWLGSGFFEDRIHPEDRAATMTLYRDVLAAGGEASAEYKAVSASGAVVWCRETIRVSGATVTGVITDITGRKQLERQLLSAGRFEALYGFAGRLAHELNNPLMIVTGYAEELMQAMNPGDPLRGEAGEILGAARRIGALAAQLSEFVRRQGKPASRVNLGDAILNLRSKITTAAGARVAVELTVNRTPVLAMADPDQLGEVLSAVIAGTRESSRERTRITIEWEVETVSERLSPTALTAGKYARITVRDDGRGLDAEQVAGVFDPVLSKATDPATFQPGLALARAYSVVHEWGGDMAFASEAGKGSTFSIYLPYIESEGARQVAVARPAARPRTSGDRETILVVDDETGIRELIRKILSRERYRVLEAGSAEEAQAAARGQEIDLVITDVMLPGINGPELARRMQQAAPRLKALYISGYTGGAIIPPGAPFLAKPFTLAALLEKVRETLGA